MALKTAAFLIAEAMRMPKGKNKEERLERSAEKWVLMEAARRLSQSDSGDSIYILEKFKREIDNYACSATSTREATMFSVAYDTIEFVIDQIGG